jgi:putative Holliday junction resolvase
MKILAVDPGDKRIGLAISDPTSTLARPLTVIVHEARAKDAERIAAMAEEQAVGLIVVGWALDAEGNVGYQARKSRRLADAIQTVTDIPVQMWDESGSTQAAIQSRIDLGVRRKKRTGHLDDLAASILLQDFLNENEALIGQLEGKDGKTS